MKLRNQKILTKGVYMKNQAKEMIESSIPKRNAKLRTAPPSNGQQLHRLVLPLIDNKKSKFSMILTFAKELFKKEDLTFEQWERLERTYSPDLSHQPQIYYRDRR